MTLLDRALKLQRAAAWARVLNISEAAMSLARKRGRLSPTLAGHLAVALHENPQQWIAIAAMEAEPDSALKNSLLRSFNSVSLYFHALLRGRPGRL